MNKDCDREISEAERQIYDLEQQQMSREDFRNRTKVSKTICDLMGDLGILGNLPESNQLSLFDFG